MGGGAFCTSGTISELLPLLACPVHHISLTERDGALVCATGCRYDIIDRVPILLPSGTRHSNESWIQESLRLAAEIRAGRQKILTPVPENTVDPHVQQRIADTNSNLYKRLIGRLKSYPIPKFPMACHTAGQVLLDIGCHWGRWSFAAAQAGFRPVGIDISLEGVLAAERIARQLGLPARFVVGDARYLPFRPKAFDAAFSYGVLQHFPKDEVHLILKSLRPVLKSGATSKLHLLNSYGLRSLQVRLSRVFRKRRFFDTSYWSPRELLGELRTVLGPSELEIDGFFTQGRFEDRELFSPFHRGLVDLSKRLTEISIHVPALAHVADNLFVVSRIS